MGDYTDRYVKNLSKSFLTKFMSHLNFDEAVADFPTDRINDRPNNSPFGFWDLLEHIRRMFKEIIDYVVNQDYEYVDTPYKYWPKPSDEPVTHTMNSTQSNHDTLTQLPIS